MSGEGPAAYLTVILTQGRSADAETLAADLLDRAVIAGGSRAKVEVQHDITTLEETFTADIPAAIVVLGGRGGWNSEDPHVSLAIQRCRENLVPVLPVCSDLGRAAAELPDVVHELNAMAWAPGKPCAEVSAVVLRMLGISDEDRRVFLSHRRSDGSVLAEQLRTALSDDRWDVFLDRFSIPPGDDFQKRLDRELADKSFVLLLETPEAGDSRWVQHEITYALQNHLNLRSLALPSTARAQLFTAVPDEWRTTVDGADVTGGPRAVRLKKGALTRIRGELELAHAHALHLRREVVLSDVKGQLLRTGRTVDLVADWVLVGDRDGLREVVLVTPRAPSPADLREVDLLRQRYRAPQGTTRGWLVHPLEELDEGRRVLLHWLTRRRLIRAAPVMLFGERLR